MSYWNPETLSELLYEIADLPDVEIKDTGFTEEELESLTESGVEAGQLKGFGDFDVKDEDDFTQFRFGRYAGKVSKEIYDSFVAKYQEIQEEYDEVMLDNVLRRWLGIEVSSQQSDSQ
jgi:histidinol phosphatase-like PHP family hydrolase